MAVDTLEGAAEGGRTAVAQAVGHAFDRLALPADPLGRQAHAQLGHVAVRLHTNSFDEALALPTENAVRLALRTQQVIAHETGVASTIDPLGGSYYVEALTDAVAKHAWELIEEVEALGGMTKAVESGMPKLRIEEAAARRQALVDRGDEVIVGVNKYRLETEDQIDILDIDNKAVREAQVTRLERIRRQRDPRTVEETLSRLAEVYDRPDTRLSSADIARSQSQPQPDGRPAVAVVFTTDGARKMRELSAAQANQRIALLLDGKVVWAPVVRTAIDKEAFINATYAGLGQPANQMVIARVL